VERVVGVGQNLVIGEPKLEPALFFEVEDQVSVFEPEV
jgi:hypothetical protein